MSGKHTKGPWRRGKHGRSIVADYPIEGGVRGTDDVEAEGGYLVAETCAEVNIPLLTAAPELLEALERLLRSYRFIKPQFAPQSDAEKQAIAAIAKATGETP